MKLGIEDEKDDALVLNFAQTLEYTDGFLAGKLLKPPETVGEDVVRLKFEWEAFDAITQEQNDEKQKTYPLKQNVITLEAGEVSKRKWYILFPDRFSEVSDELTRGFEDGDPKKIFGLVVAKFIASSQSNEIFKMLAENHAEIFEKVEFAVSNSELDDAVKSKFNELLDTNLNRMRQLQNGTVDNSI